ncbi:MAG: hypothetical protein ACTSWN_06065 [Promethearchaeota archaeon]
MTSCVFVVIATASFLDDPNPFNMKAGLAGTFDPCTYPFQSFALLGKRGNLLLQNVIIPVAGRTSPFFKFSIGYEKLPASFTFQDHDLHGTILHSDIKKENSIDTGIDALDVLLKLKIVRSVWIVFYEGNPVDKVLDIFFSVLCISKSLLPGQEIFNLIPQASFHRAKFARPI